MLAVILLVLTLWICIKTISYGIYEIKKNKNTPGGVVVIIIAITALVFPNFMVWINGFY